MRDVAHALVRDVADAQAGKRQERRVREEAKGEKERHPHTHTQEERTVVQLMQRDHLTDTNTQHPHALEFGQARSASEVIREPHHLVISDAVARDV